MLFNQREAKVFMGDSGSLFLGYYVATSPLLLMETATLPTSTLNMTPFILLATFLIADTSRVFCTRILSGKSPMDADTNHFHHVVIRNSGSYLITLFMVYGVISVCSIFAILSYDSVLNQSDMILHISLIFLFILTPPAPSYVNLITQMTKPVYNWQNSLSFTNRSYQQTLFISFFILVLIISTLTQINYVILLNWKLFFSILLIIPFVIVHKDKLINSYIINLFIILFF